ncbi:PADRE domain [Dillenia turbinata]|uniref:PADRE domain n=1 Tax=Dillenia turbinata TaxID=194707 RepID=A0AAN8Z8V2_9MAGN
MGNSLRSKRSAKIMKIDGQTFKIKTPTHAGEIVKDYPGHVLLESEAVKHFGIRAQPLEPHQELKPKRLYFLVELPKFPQDQRITRRVRSGIHMSAKDRLESLMLARRSSSDLSIMKPAGSILADGPGPSGPGPARVRMRLPKAEVEKLMKESRDETEVAEKIMELCIANANNSNSEEALMNDNNVRKSAGKVSRNVR